MLKKLPLGVTTFKDIRDKKENYLYVDKTDIAYSLIDSGKYYFLSRPRRFGKSLFLDTLADIFLGKKELLKGFISMINGIGKRVILLLELVLIVVIFL